MCLLCDIKYRILLKLFLNVLYKRLRKRDKLIYVMLQTLRWRCFFIPALVFLYEIYEFSRELFFS